MDDQLVEDCGPTEDRPAQVSKTPTQASLQVDAGEELLHQHQSGEGRQGLIFTSQFRDRVGFTTNIGSARLHGMVLFGACGLTCTQYSQRGPLFKYFYENNVNLLCSFLPVPHCHRPCPVEPACPEAEYPLILEGFSKKPARNLVSYATVR